MKDAEIFVYRGGIIGAVRDLINDITQPITDPINAFLYDQLYEWY